MFIVLKQQICRVPYQHGLSSALAVYVGTTSIATPANRIGNRLCDHNDNS